MYYVNYFFIMAILGHFIESFFSSHGKSGILLSYWTPIYGIGSIIILIIYKCVNKRKMHQFCKFITFFPVCAVTLSFIEMVGGYLLKYIFDKKLWDYSNHLFNIGKYTSLEMAILWGICSIIFIYLIRPIIDKFVNMIPSFISYMCITLFIIDLITTIIIKTN